MKQPLKEHVGSNVEIQILQLQYNCQRHLPILSLYSEYFHLLLDSCANKIVVCMNISRMKRFFMLGYGILPRNDQEHQTTWLVVRLTQF